MPPRVGLRRVPQEQVSRLPPQARCDRGGEEERLAHTEAALRTNSADVRRLLAHYKGVVADYRNAATEKAAEERRLLQTRAGSPRVMYKDVDVHSYSGLFGD